MLDLNSQHFHKVIDCLKADGVPLTAAITNSVCPQNSLDIIDKFLGSGVPPRDLSKAIAQAFDFEIYDKSIHGSPKARCKNHEWCTSEDGRIFFTQNPFRSISPNQVLNALDAKKIKKTGMLPIDKDRGTQETGKIKAKCEQIIEKWLSKAIRAEATDIHISPLNGASVRVSYRVDGQLVPQEDFQTSLSSKGLYHHIGNTLMRLCNQEAAVFSHPKDGKFHFSTDIGELEVRLAMRPVNVRGMSSMAFWLRLLKPEGKLEFPSIDELGLASQASTLLKKFSRANQSLVLITGPTGSGKTTTLYSVLATIQKEAPWRSIQTLEDPVEVHIDGIDQTQINFSADMSFASGLRSMMRSDVDVILIGEIRDEETAKLAIRAALTGHLVLATIHCKTALESIGRLIDLGVTSSLISNVLACSFAQRLVRKVCPACSQRLSYKKAKSKYGFNGLFGETDSITIEKTNQNCKTCYGTGYKGRVVVSEALPITKELKYEIIRQNLEGMESSAKHAVTLWGHAVELIKAGITTLEECNRMLPNRFVLAQS